VQLDSRGHPRYLTRLNEGFKDEQGSSVSNENSTDKLLELLAGGEAPTPNEFKSLVLAVDSHNVLAKVFLLEGTPYVFSSSPMKYVIFREQVAERFSVGSQDVCIVGSAKLGFSPSPVKFGKQFKEESDVDVVIISEDLFHQGSFELFRSLNHVAPPVHVARAAKAERDKSPHVQVDAREWIKVKEGLRNYTFNNFNPSLLPGDNPLRQEIFDKISSTAGLFLALEPQVFVSKIRCRLFRYWKAAEAYYANSLRQLKATMLEGDYSTDLEEIDTGELDVPSVMTSAA
jgi:hypothetical protein